MLSDCLFPFTWPELSFLLVTLFIFVFCVHWINVMCTRKCVSTCIHLSYARMEVRGQLSWVVYSLLPSYWDMPLFFLLCYVLLDLIDNSAFSVPHLTMEVQGYRCMLPYLAFDMALGFSLRLSDLHSKHFCLLCHLCTSTLFLVQIFLF